MNRIFALRSGNSVTLNINGQTRNLALETEEEAKELFRKAFDVKSDPTDEKVKELLAFVDPSHRVLDSGILERDRIGNFYLRGYNIPMPKELVQKIREYSTDGFPLTALENFWKLCMRNPDPRARQDLFAFADQFHFPITESGYFIAYKAVAGVNMKHKDYALFVTREFINMKSVMKNNPKDFSVILYGEEGEQEMEVLKTSEIENWLKEMVGEEEDAQSINAHNWLREKNKLQYAQVVDHLDEEEFMDLALKQGYEHIDLTDQWKTENNFVVKGTLQKCFDDLNDLFESEGKSFTDFHTRRMTIKLGQPVLMDRDRCDGDPNRTCSSGLHVGAPEYVRTFGHDNDRFILACLVNPANVVAVPVDYSYQKMRCCEYYPYAICEMTDNGFLKELETPYFEADYCGYEKEQLEEELRKAQIKMNTGNLTAEEEAAIQEQISLIGNRLFLVGDAAPQLPAATEDSVTF